MKTLFLVLFSFLFLPLTCTESFAAGPVARSISVNGVERTYLVHIPAKYDKAKKLPLVFALHGGSGSGKDQIKLTRGGLSSLADKNSFIVVYPNASFVWNDGRARMAKNSGNADDTGFLLALIDRLVAEKNVDPKKVYITGISNGGQMAFRMACEHADRIAAIAPVAAALAEGYYPRCKPSGPVPVLMINGMKDPVQPWRGGYTSNFPGAALYERTLSVADTVKFWVKNNKCSASPQIEALPDKYPKDGTTVKRETYSQCAGGSEVVLYGIDGGGHTWPGGYQYAIERFIGKTSKDIDANSVIWEFFSRH